MVGGCDGPLDKDVTISWEAFLVLLHWSVSGVGAELLQSIVKEHWKSFCFPSQEGLVTLLWVSRSHRLSPSLGLEVMALGCALQHNHSHVCVPQEHPCSCPTQLSSLCWLWLLTLSLKVWCGRCFARFNLCTKLVSLS